ncbi:hypothetical protein KSP39_PZI004432 [Platanthera zijinensis]|uniref:Uncharacterized protein n=1 Tax=Platanthera zijinensis TaxID=2320716 RepID=A0AAP0GDI1_9ASPA
MESEAATNRQIIGAQSSSILRPFISINFIANLITGRRLQAGAAMSTRGRCSA